MVIIKEGDPKPAQFKCGYCCTIFEATVGEYYVSYEGSFDEEHPKDYLTLNCNCPVCKNKCKIYKD